MNAEVSLSCEGIERFLGEEDSRVHALRGVSRQLERGTVHSVVGPSGCGKSVRFTSWASRSARTRPSHDRKRGRFDLADDELAEKRNELIGFIFQFHFPLEDLPPRKPS